MEDKILHILTENMDMHVCQGYQCIKAMCWGRHYSLWYGPETWARVSLALSTVLSRALLWTPFGHILPAR